MRAAILIFLLLGPVCASAQDEPKLPRIVSKPAAAFLESHPLGPIMEIRYDFDCDGQMDVAYADHASCGHQGYCQYEIFLRRSAHRYIEVGSIGCMEHLRIHPSSKVRGGIIQTFQEKRMTTYRISGRGLRKLREERNPLHYDLTTGEVPKTDHASILQAKTYSIERFSVIAHE